LIKRGANAKEDGLLSFAALKNKPEIVNILVEAGANLNKIGEDL
jgi:hypothetical protein